MRLDDFNVSSIKTANMTENNRNEHEVSVL